MAVVYVIFVDGISGYEVCEIWPIVDMGISCLPEKAVYVVVDSFEETLGVRYAVGYVVRRLGYKRPGITQVEFRFEARSADQIQSLLCANDRFAVPLEIDSERLRFIFIVPADYFSGPPIQ